MPTLKRIEARLLRTLQGRTHEDDVRLLIRAVKQLNAQVNALKNGDKDLYSEGVPALDPDVLELLEGEQE